MTPLKRFAPVLAAGLSALSLFFSTGLAGTVSPDISPLWIVALFAPVPVLWFAFRAERGWAAFLAASTASALGSCNLLFAYAGTLPPIVLVLVIALPALSFAASALAARFVAERLAPISGAVAFAALWTGFDYLLSLGGNGTATSPANAFVASPAMIQIASVFGGWGITAVAGLVAAGLAMALAKRVRSLAVFAVAVLALNLGYGTWRLHTAPATPTMRVALAADDTLVGLRFKDDAASALKVVQTYAATGETLAQKGAFDLIVFPERTAMRKTDDQALFDAPLQALALKSHAMVVIGADLRKTPRQNGALVYFANGAAPLSYAKRHLVPGLETIFTPGSQSFMAASSHVGVAICKDMDFPATLRADAIVAPGLYAVPAWDFDKDGAWHARLAILRGVENGFAVARSANSGLLTVSDAYGRVIAARSSSDPQWEPVTILHGPTMKTLVASVAKGPGNTLYGSIGDGLAIITLGLAAILLLAAMLAGDSRAKTAL
jgi:apolipoprotein N-acyltransferase